MNTTLKEAVDSRKFIIFLPTIESDSGTACVGRLLKEHEHYKCESCSKPAVYMWQAHKILTPLCAKCSKNDEDNFDTYGVIALDKEEVQQWI